MVGASALNRMAVLTRTRTTVSILGLLANIIPPEACNQALSLDLGFCYLIAG
jgi:hypothetical protein